MVQTLQSVARALEGVEAVSTRSDDTPESIRARILAAVHRVDRGQGVIILHRHARRHATNQSLAIARDTGAEVVAGVNMPILIKLTTARGQMDAHTLAGFIQRYGQEHILLGDRAARGAPGRRADHGGARDRRGARHPRDPEPPRPARACLPRCSSRPPPASRPA